MGHKIKSHIGIDPILVIILRYSSITCIEPVEAILEARGELAACHSTGQVHSRCPISDVRLLVTAHLQNNGFPLTVLVGLDRITERVVFFKARICLVSSPLWLSS